MRCQRHWGSLALQLWVCQWRNALPCSLDLLQSLPLLWSPLKLGHLKGNSVNGGSSWEGTLPASCCTTKGVLKTASEWNKLWLPSAWQPWLGWWPHRTKHIERACSLPVFACQSLVVPLLVESNGNPAGKKQSICISATSALHIKYRRMSLEMNLQ